MTAGPDEGSPRHDLLGEDSIHGLSQGLVAAPELETLAPAGLPGPQLIPGVWGKEKVAVFGTEERRARAVVVHSPDADYEESDALTVQRGHERDERLRPLQRDRRAAAKCSRDCRNTTSTEVLSAPDWFSGADSTSSTMRTYSSVKVTGPVSIRMFRNGSRMRTSSSYSSSSSTDLMITPRAHYATSPSITSVGSVLEDRRSSAGCRPNPDRTRSSTGSSRQMRRVLITKSQSGSNFFQPPAYATWRRRPPAVSLVQAPRKIEPHR